MLFWQPIKQEPYLRNLVWWPSYYWNISQSLFPLDYIFMRSEMPITIKTKILIELGKGKPEKVLRGPPDFWQIVSFLGWELVARLGVETGEVERK